MQETQTEREQRKNMYISHVLSRARGMGDHEEIMEEAHQKWEMHNREDE